MFFLVSAAALFSNFQNDRNMDKKLAFYAYNTNSIQNIYSSVSRLFYLSYKYSSTPSLQAKTEFVHLVNSLDYQFYIFLRNSNKYGSTSLSDMQKEYEAYLQARDLIQVLFEKRLPVHQKAIALNKLRVLEDNILSELSKIANENYTDVSYVFRQRTLSYEKLLVFYLGALGFFILFGFGSLVYFYIRNFYTPYRKFLRSIESIKEGDFNTRVHVTSNKEFSHLAEAFNGMIDRLLEIDIQLKDHIDNIEKIVDEKTRELEDKNTQLMVLDELKDQFLQNISHELRTPLTSILGYVEIVLNYGNIAPTQASFLKIAHENSLSLLKIINKLLLLSEIESGNTMLQIESVDLAEIIKNTVKKMKVLADNKNIGISINVDAGTTKKDLLIDVDEDKMESVFSNLISNAIKFTKDGQVTIEISADSEQMVIEVEDTGIGMTEEEQSIIFDKFRQVDNSLTKLYEGTGLGLPIVKNVLDLHGAEISVNSLPEQGSVFTVIIPKKKK